MQAEPKLPGRLLYVEDDEVTRSALGATLARLVESVVVAESGKAGLEAFAARQPDLVVTDITMPGMSGLAMARELKQTHPDVPIIVTTAYSDTQYLLEAIEVGIDGYVLKPVDFERVVILVRRHLAAVEAERARRRTLAELEAALAEVKRLSGLLPMCSYCKSIRDDAGYWASVEEYLSEHSEARLSHGICPDCIAEHFPDEQGLEEG